MHWWGGQFNLSAKTQAGSSAVLTLLWRSLAALLLGMLLAKWIWVLFAPRSVVAPVAVVTSSPAQTGNLFGSAAISSVSGQVAALPNVRLVGIFAGSPGFAVLELDGKRQVGVATGGEIVPGAKLLEVAADHVVIERGGLRQQVPLEGKASAVKSATAATVAAVPIVPVIQPVAATPVVQSASAPVTPAWQEMRQRMMRGREGF